MTKEKGCKETHEGQKNNFHMQKNFVPGTERHEKLFTIAT